MAPRDAEHPISVRVDDHDTDLLQVVLAKARQCIEIDLVLGEHVHVSTEAQIVQPVGDVVRHSCLIWTCFEWKLRCFGPHNPLAQAGSPNVSEPA